MTKANMKNTKTKTKYGKGIGNTQVQPVQTSWPFSPSVRKDAK